MGKIGEAEFSKQAINALSEIQGQHIWNGARSLGTYLTFEFGLPIIQFREPRQFHETDMPRVVRHWKRRRVTIRGEWHLWLQNCNWEIECDGFIISNQMIASRATTADHTDLAEILSDLDGQKLADVRLLPNDGGIELLFDLGGRLHFWAGSQNDGDQWNLFKGLEPVLGL